MTKRLLILTLVVISMVPSVATANDEIFYTSRPDMLAVFLNDIAFAQDNIVLPGGADIRIVLPDTIYVDTLVVYENESRVPTYRINRQSGQTILHWLSASSTAVRQVRLDYLMRGISWQPKYDMWLGADEDTTVEFDFYVEIQNSALTLDEVELKLIAGRVDTSQALADVTTITTNQYVAGYDTTAGSGQDMQVGAAQIQHVYEVGNINAIRGDVVYTRLQESTLPARRVHLWNAASDNQVTVIYKVRNETTMPFAQGIVRNYQNGLFIGSDFIELTPINSEGSVTVGTLQTVRAQRDETVTYVGGELDTRYDVEMQVTNFAEEPVAIEVVDSYRPHATNFEFSLEPERQAGNLLRWSVIIEPGQTLTITYAYLTD